MPNLISENVVFIELRQTQASCIAFTISRSKSFHGTLMVVFDPSLHILLHHIKLQELRLQQLPDFINKTTIIRIKLLAGWVPPHDGKRIIGIQGLPWNSAKVRILTDPGLWPKGRVVRTITKISAEVYLSFLHGWEIKSILVRSCTDKVCENCGDPSIKWTKRYYMAD